MRIFTGIELNDSLINRIESFKKNNKLSGLRYTQNKNLHLTTFFIGEINPLKLDYYINTIEETTKKLNAFQLNTYKIDFSPGNNPYMIWQYFDYSEAYNQLCNELCNAVKNKTIGLKTFTPHITIARFKNDKKYYKLNQTEETYIPLTVNKIMLWESAADNKSRRYSLKAYFDLKP